MKNQLPEKYNNSFWRKIKNFFSNIFSSNTATEINNTQEYSDNYNEKVLNNEKNEDLQKKYENGQILVSNMSDEQYEMLRKMYSEQINKIKTKITEKEMKLYKNLV